MILVTGGTGLVGAHLLHRLVQSEDKVRAIYRNPDKIEAVRSVFKYFTDDVESLFEKIEWIKADILDIPSLNDCFVDISQVYHCAALVSFDPNDYHVLRKTNIEGTANVVNQCLAKGIKKLCYVSSVAAIGDERPGHEITEESPWNPEADHNVYSITKYGAEMEVWRGTQEGLKSVIVNPGIILGGGFWRSGSGSLFKRISKGLKYYTNGKTGYVDIHDVVGIMEQLMKSDIINERFILISENWSFKEFTQSVATKLGSKVPYKQVKPWLLKVAWRLDWLRHAIRGKRRKITRQTANSLMTEKIFSNEKIKKVLDFEFKPLETSIDEVCQLFLQDA
ncbi:MAG: NAD-dependent epimerase/dehydratase family protein [Flavobacteriaceae bacterium]|nr:NAD-dependent epimerase/dehydratase family protein [Flavobacteriaceae bacterium]